ncbi:hypothetical protein [Celeribacter marinus]|uniref:hypothetical protein n=1 Tax=Celeribacter marinus TaxID=1397108 RepID=UPI0031721C71
MSSEYGLDDHGPARWSPGIRRLHGAECPKCQCKFVYDCTGHIECNSCGEWQSTPSGALALFEFAQDLAMDPLEFGEEPESLSMSEFVDANESAKESAIQIAQRWKCSVHIDNWLPDQSALDGLNLALGRRGNTNG